MSNRIFAESAYEIPSEALEKGIPGILQEIKDASEDFIEYVQDDEGDLDNFSEEVNSIVDKIIKFGEEHGLELAIGYRYLEDADDDGLMNPWYVWCVNAVTLNPAFTKAGGELSLWTVAG